MSPLVKRLMFAVAGGYVLFSPFLPQVLGVGYPWVRQWTMYSGVGVGLLKGVFTGTTGDGEQVILSPLALQGLKRYPDTYHYTFAARVTSVEDLRIVTAPICVAKGLSDLRFDGRIGTDQGWAAFAAAELCREPPPGATLLTAEAPDV